MTFFPARILSTKGMVVAEDVRVWITFFHIGNVEVWDGSFDVPVTTFFIEPTYQLQFDDGRQGTMTNINTWIMDENIIVYFEGVGSLEEKQEA